MRAPSRWTRPWAVVEIASGSDERERTELIRAAYKSSRSGVVALALRGVTRETADRALDPVVDTKGNQEQGVIYMDADHAREELLFALSNATVVVASTEGFRSELLKHGIQSVGVADVPRVLLGSADC